MENWIVSQFGNLPDGSDDKEFACSSGDPGSIPGLERSPGEGNDNPLQNSCLENFMNREAWQATIHGVTKSWTLLMTLKYQPTDNLLITERQNMSL